MIRTETDRQACRTLWETFSPQQDAWDDWDLISAFHDPANHHFIFLVHQAADGSADGLLPLVRDTKRERCTLMGGSYPDARVPWLPYEQFPEFFEQLPEPTALFDLKESWVCGLLERYPEYEENCRERDLRYYLVPAEFDFNFYRHIDTFAADKRQKFLYDLRNIGKREPVVQWGTGNEADLFIDLVNRNFGTASDHADPDNAAEVKRVVTELERSGRLKTLTIEVEGAKQAVSLSLLHGNKMIALYAASNNDYNNLGKLLNVETIQEACRLRLEEISFMTGMQWKANWKMMSEPCVTLRKPPAPEPPAPQTAAPG